MITSPQGGPHAARRLQRHWSSGRDPQQAAVDDDADAADAVLDPTDVKLHNTTDSLEGPRVGSSKRTSSVTSSAAAGSAPGRVQPDPAPPSLLIPTDPDPADASPPKPPRPPSMLGKADSSRLSKGVSFRADASDASMESVTSDLPGTKENPAVHPLPPRSNKPPALKISDSLKSEPSQDPTDPLPETPRTPRRQLDGDSESDEEEEDTPLHV